MKIPSGHPPSPVTAPGNPLCATCSSSHPNPRPLPALSCSPLISVTPALTSQCLLTVPAEFTPQHAPSHASPCSLSAPPILHCSPPLNDPSVPLQYILPYPSPPPTPQCSPHSEHTAPQPLPLPAVPSLTAGCGVPRRAGPGGGREAAEATDGSYRRRHLRRGRMRERPPGASPRPPRPRRPSRAARCAACASLHRQHGVTAVSQLSAVSRVFLIRIEWERIAGEAGERLRSSCGGGGAGQACGGQPGGWAGARGPC